MAMWKFPRKHSSLSSNWIRIFIPFPVTVFVFPRLIDNNSKIPEYVTRVTETIEKAGFEAFIVGGCVRDLILGREPKDWDITTNATPDKIIEAYSKTFYEKDITWKTSDCP